MSQYQSDFMRVMESRGYIHQITDADALDARLKSGPVTAYVGYDCTAPSLHIGNLISIMMLRWFQETGNKPLVLMGGVTSRVGDPSGKDASRQLLSTDQIDQNMANIRSAFEQFLSFGNGTTDAVMVNNADWLGDVGYIDFLRQVGPHFTLNRMMTFESVKQRLDREQPLTFLEFNYMVLQAYDFLQLSRSHDCALQLGGSDQWGNIVNGIELARRLDQRTLFGMTTPLMTTADGKKMGKSVNGAVWLNEAALPAYDYWQYWRNVDDADVVRFLKLFTLLPLDDIAALEGDIQAGDGAAINAAKVLLADEATGLARGKEAAERARQTAETTFSGGTGSDLPSLVVTDDDIAAGKLLIDLYVDLGLADSKGAARRLVRQGGARLNGTAIGDEDTCLQATDFSDGEAKLSAGKKRHARLIKG